MKLVIFTPTIKASAIGRMARLVSQSLVSLGHDVVIVRAEAKSLFSATTHDFGAPMIRWDDASGVLEAISNADSISYHIGDNFPFHEGCLEWLPRHSGVVCLHDFFLGHLFSKWAESHPDLANQILKRWYGEEGANVFFDTSTNTDFITRTSDVAPMTEWICALADGVITHSHWGTARAIRSCPGPVQVVPIAYDAPALAECESTSLRRPENFRLLTIGHINRNKRVASVLRAIGGSSILRNRCVYRLVGHIEPAMIVELSSLASSLRVNLVIGGEADDRTLATALAEADVVSCLRWPSLEAASASAVESMLYGKATIVTDTGFYKEIAADCVEKIAHEDEVEALRDVLEKLFLSPDLRQQLGTNAKRWATQTYSATHYANALVLLTEACAGSRARTIAQRFFYSVLQRWGATPHMTSSKEVIGNSLGLAGVVR
jgi:glycosyltransferase involved in cell wall biosynthesis